MHAAQKSFETFYTDELLAKTPRAADTNKVLRMDDSLFRLKWDGKVWSHTIENETIYLKIARQSTRDAAPLLMTEFIAGNPWQDLLDGEPAWMKIEFADSEKTLLREFTLRIVSSSAA